MKRKYVIMWLLIGVLLVLGLYFGKRYYLNNYSLLEKDYKEYIQNLKINDTLNISNVEVDDYLEFQNLKIRNDFKDFKLEKDEEDTKKYCKYDESGNLVASIWLEKSNSWVKKLKENDEEINSYFNRGLNSKGRTSILKSNNIKDDSDLIEYIINHKVSDTSIFSSLKEIKTNYFIRVIVLFIIPENSEYSLIRGDLKGYISSFNDNFKSIYITDGDTLYTLTLLGQDFSSPEYIKDLLSTITLKNI